MQTILDTRQLKMGMCMLNMQFYADNGLMWSVKLPKINYIENPNIPCFAKGLAPFTYTVKL